MVDQLVVASSLAKLIQLRRPVLATVNRSFDVKRGKPSHSGFYSVASSSPPTLPLCLVDSVIQIKVYVFRCNSQFATVPCPA